MEKTFQNIETYLKNHGLLTLATVSPEGLPMAHSVEYIHEGNTIYFISHQDTRKMANIANNPKVAYTVDEDYQDWTVIQGIQMMGEASFVQDPAEFKRLMGIYMQKFPQVKVFPQEMVEAMKLVKVEPVHAKYIDNTQGMGHHELIEY